MQSPLDAIPTGPWDGEATYANAVRTLKPVLSRIDTPLSFTNGDHQPANFLTDGKAVTGFLDFEDACLRDSLMSLTKYPVYDLHPFNKAGFVDLYLDRMGISRSDFAPRLAFMCLVTLQREIPVRPDSEDQSRYQAHVLRLLDEAMAGVRQM